MNFATASLIVISLAFVQVIAESDDEPTEATIDEWTQQCKMETEVDVQLLEDEKLDVAIDDSKVKCFYACMMKKIGFMSADGTVDKEKMNNYMPPEVSEERKNRLKETRPICLELTGENECETAFLIRNCIRRRFQIRSGPYDDVPGAYFAKLIEECEAETGADHKLVEIALRGTEVINPKVKSWFTCMYKKYKFMSANNVIDKTRITNFIQYYVLKENREYVKNHRAQCAESVGANEYETPYLIDSCLSLAMKYYDKVEKILPNGQNIWISASNEECIKETGADPTLINSAFNNGSVDDQNVKCYFACSAKRAQQMTEDGIVNKKRIINSYLSSFPSAGIKGLLKQPISECVEITGKDSCETAYRIHECAESRIRNLVTMLKYRIAATKPRLAECAENVDLELLTAEAVDQVARDPEVKCYYACLYKKLNYMFEDGTINKTQLIDTELKRLKSTKVQKMAEKNVMECVELSGENECDTAHLIDICLDSTVQNISKQGREDCRNKNHVDLETLKTELTNKNPGQNIKCYRACIFEKDSLIAENGTLFKDDIARKFVSNFPEEVREKAIQPLIECTELVGEDKCDTAYLVYKCLMTLRMKFENGEASQ